VPELPAWRELGSAGTQWWEWAWRTPQACAWDDGQLLKVADRAALEDDLVAVSRADFMGDFLEDSLGVLASNDDFKAISDTVSSIARLLAGKISIQRQINEIDDRLGLSPKGRDQLRLKIVADDEYYPAEAPKRGAAAREAAAKVTDLADRRKRSVDAS